ncbi:MAG TPA: hypothetical protein VII45_02450 [Solirubrobacterales bacterium]
MDQETKPNKKARTRLTYANVVSTIALFLAVGGATAFAANELGKNSVGSRQLKSKSVTTGKIANNAVNGAKVAKHSLTGDDINLAALGTVPTAASATAAGNADTVGGHAATCPPATTLIRGTCFDTAAGPEVANVKLAADACAIKGGYLPTPMELYSTRGVLNLGTGIGNDRQFTDAYYGNSLGTKYSTVVIDGTGELTEQAVTSPAHYTCAYNLVR